MGLHAHHPRNCLFYLRDKDPADLQKLLVMNKINFTSFVDSSGTSCSLQIQKENTMSQLFDDKCNAEIESNQHAGFCRYAFFVESRHSESSLFFCVYYSSTLQGR